MWHSPYFETNNNSHKLYIYKERKNKEWVFGEKVGSNLIIGYCSDKTNNKNLFKCKLQGWYCKLRLVFCGLQMSLTNQKIDIKKNEKSLPTISNYSLVCLPYIYFQLGLLLFVVFILLHN